MTAGSAGKGRPAAFLDRDGTIIVERYYLADPAGVRIVDGVTAALRRLQDAGYALVIVTNQSGIARGLYTTDDFLAVQRRVEEVLEQEGVRIDAVRYCPHHPDFTGACDCRKPGTLLFREVAATLGLDFAASLFVGDRIKDVLPARELGGRAFLVRTGYGALQETEADDDIEVVDDLAAAVSRVLAGRAGGTPG